VGIFHYAFLTAKERDNESGLDYFGARYYSGAQGRFTSHDPFNPILRISKKSQFDLFLSQPQNWNAYSYTWNNPLRFVDPNGESVYIVLYTQGNSKADDELRRAANAKAAAIASSKGFDSKNDTVLVRGVTTKSDVANAFKAANDLGKTFGGVQQLNMFSHSGANDGVVLHDPAAISPANPHGATQFKGNELQSLPSLNWNDGATATFYGCNTTNFAGKFASTANVTSFGTTGTSYFSSRPDRLSPDKGASLYLIDTYFNQHLVPNFINYTKPMEEHDAK
jgi:RHS repeat-associated protein